MDPNPYQSPLAPVEQFRRSKPRKELRPLFGVPGAVLMLLFSGLMTLMVVQDFIIGKRSIPLLGIILPIFCLAAGAALFGQLARQYLRQDEEFDGRAHQTPPE